MTTSTDTVRNGVDTASLFGTLDAVKAQPELGRFQFRARNVWLGGAHNRSTIKEFYGAGQEDTSRNRDFVLDAGEPAILLGRDTGPNPAEALLHALAACLTTSLVYVAAAERLRELVIRAQQRSAVFDMVTRGLPVSVSASVEAETSNVRAA